MANQDERSYFFTQQMSCIVMIVSKSLNVVPVQFVVIFAIITAILLRLYQHPC